MVLLAFGRNGEGRSCDIIEGTEFIRATEQPGAIQPAWLRASASVRTVSGWERSSTKDDFPSAADFPGRLYGPRLHSVFGVGCSVFGPNTEHRKPETAPMSYISLYRKYR